MRRAGGLVLLALGVAGCAAAPRAQRERAADAPLRVDAAGRALSTGPGVDARVVAARVGELLRTGRPNAARRALLRNPEAAAEVAATSPGVEGAVQLAGWFERAQRALHAAIVATSASDPARELWDAAIVATVTLAETGACAPALFELVLDKRPVELPWSDEHANRLAALAEEGLLVPQPADGVGLEPVCAAWAIAGAQRLERREPSAALIAFSRAEAASTSAVARAHLRIARGAALLLAGRTDGARTALAMEASSDEPAVARAALAHLGKLELAEDRPKLAQTWLERALALEVPGDDPGLGRVQANLALALLSLGEEARGLELLHAAQATFARRGTPAALADLELALENELAARAGSTAAELEPVRARIAQLR